MKQLRNKKFQILITDPIPLLNREVKSQIANIQIQFIMLKDFAEIATTARVEINLQLNVNI
jgi:hypothetical protein